MSTIFISLGSKHSLRVSFDIFFGYEFKTCPAVKLALFELTPYFKLDWELLYAWFDVRWLEVFFIYDLTFYISVVMLAIRTVSLSLSYELFKS